MMRKEINRNDDEDDGPADAWYCNAKWFQVGNFCPGTGNRCHPAAFKNVWRCILQGPLERRSPSSCEIAMIDQGPDPSNNTQARVNGTDRMPTNRRDHNSPEIYSGQLVDEKDKESQTFKIVPTTFPSRVWRKLSLTPSIDHETWCHHTSSSPRHHFWFTRTKSHRAALLRRSNT